MNSHEYFFGAPERSAERGTWQATEQALERWDYGDVSREYRALDELPSSTFASGYFGFSREPIRT